MAWVELPKARSGSIAAISPNCLAGGSGPDVLSRVSIHFARAEM